MASMHRDLLTTALATLILGFGFASASLAQQTKPKTVSPEATAALASEIKEIFRAHCLACHGEAKANGGLKIHERDSLIKNDRVVPGKPEDSLLIQRITADDDSVMPPAGRPRLNPEQVETIRRWVAEGAPDFGKDIPQLVEANKDPALARLVGVDYVLKQILRHVRALKPEDRPYARYFSSNHILSGGATAAELDLQREALAKAINHLTWEPRIVPLEAIEPSKTIFRIDLRSLGWDRRPFRIVRDGQLAGPGRLNLFDLALLEYPYGVVYESSETFDALAVDFLNAAGQVRPIPYLRSDWFVSTATQPPLYEDFLQLPINLKELENRLGVDSETNLSNGRAHRAGMAVSGVSRNNRVVERHPLSSREGAYWKSFDTRTSKGIENIFKDPVNLKPAGGEMIFNLPNGLQGYLLANGAGVRVDAAPTEIVTDKFAEDKTVRNGLSCMRCHEVGMKGFIDAVRPAVEALPGSPGFDRRLVLQLYPVQSEMDAHLKEDSDRFNTAVAKALGKRQVREPLAPVSQRFLDAPIPLSAAGAELGLADPAELRQVFRSRFFSGLGLAPLVSGGAIRRDMWEDYYDQVVRQLGIGVPVVPIDALTRLDFQPDPIGFDVRLATNRKNNTFAPGDELVIVVKNPSKVAVFIELIGTNAEGGKVVLTTGLTRVEAGGEYHFPPEGAIKVRGNLGKERVTVFAFDKPFPEAKLFRGEDVTDRVVHQFSQKKDKATDEFDPSLLLKRTIEIETR